MRRRALKPQHNVLRKRSGFSMPWYRPGIDPQLRAATLILFEKYCNLTGSELENHIYSIVSRLKPPDKSKPGEQFISIGKFGSIHALVSGVSQSPESTTVGNTTRYLGDLSPSNDSSILDAAWYKTCADWQLIGCQPRICM